MSKASWLLCAGVLLVTAQFGPTAEPDVPKSETVKPGTVKPDPGKPGTAKPQNPKAGTVKPKVAKPGKAKPGKAKPGTAKPEIAELPPVKLEPAPEIFESSVPPAEANQIDKIVFTKLSALGIRPVLCSDAVFVRRAYLDVIGTLPTAEEAREFIQDPDTKNKHRVLIDRLLEREEFADYWAMKWGDILRIKAEFPVNLWPNAAQAYHRWIWASITEDKPYDMFVRELLTSSGSNFRVGPVNFYRAIQNRTPEGIATAVALAFMGSRVDAWPKDRLPGMAVFFSQIGYKPTREWKEEHVIWDPLHCTATETQAAAAPPPKSEPKKPPAPVKGKAGKANALAAKSTAKTPTGRRRGKRGSLK